MDVSEAILCRRSVRSYTDKDVPKAKIEKIMNSVRMAPSASNRQDWRFVIIENEEKIKKIQEAVRQPFVKEAPIIIAGITTDPEYKMSCEIPRGIVNLSIALDHLTLKATEENLGTCWIGAFDQEKAKKVLNIPPNHQIVALMTLGYPKKPLEKKDKNRKDSKDIISYNTLQD